MTLTVCRECRKEVSTEAPVCPHCGAPAPASAPSPALEVIRRLGGLKGRGFEWRSQRTLLGYPLVHVAIGRDELGRLRVAKGVIAVGQFAIGLITVAQFGVGLLFGFGQFILGLTALAQFAGALLAGVGQFATGYVAVGQVVLGYYGLAQAGWAKYLWSTGRKDPEAWEFFQSLLDVAREWLDWPKKTG